MVDPLLDIWIEQPIDYVAEGRALVSLPTVNDEGDADDYLSPLD